MPDGTPDAVESWAEHVERGVLDADELETWRRYIEANRLGAYADPDRRDGPYFRLARLLATIDARDSRIAALEQEREELLDLVSDLWALPIGIREQATALRVADALAPPKEPHD